MDKWINKAWSVCTMDYYPIIPPYKDGCDTCYSMNEFFKEMVLSKMS